MGGPDSECDDGPGFSRGGSRDMRPSLTAMGSILEQAGVALPPEGLQKLWNYHQLLREANERLNLTRIHQFENMVIKHYVDSLLILKYTELPDPLVDIGSGPGLPGIPLAIARPEVRLILAESRRNRTQFLKDVVEKLALPNVEVHTGSVGQSFGREVAAVVTRAVASISSTLDLCAGCLKPGGRILFMKGPGCDPEIKEARRSHEASFRLVDDHAYVIPGTTHERRLLIYQLKDATPEALNVSNAGTSKSITSPSNPWFRAARLALTGKGIREHRAALLSGARVVPEAVSRFPDRVKAWITTEDGPQIPSALRGHATWVQLAPSLFRELDVSGTHSPLLLIDAPEPPPWDDEAAWPEGCTLFVPFQDPENVGAAIRSATAFGASRVVLLREAANPYHPKASRAAGIALLGTTLERGPSIQDLAVRRAPLIALGLERDSIIDMEWPDRFGLIAGLEGPGLPDSLRRNHENLHLRRIPIQPGVESLNAATSVALALYEWARTRASV
jgi:16S rRNA (guanine527-N7)-methyltransferase